MPPNLQRALRLDESETASRYQELHGEPVSTIFVTELTPRERLRWLRDRLAAQLESLPPFCLAISLTLTVTAGGGALALPTGAVVLVAARSLPVQRKSRPDAPSATTITEKAAYEGRSSGFTPVFQFSAIICTSNR